MELQQHISHDLITEEFYDFVSNNMFPCVIAKNLGDKKNINVMIAGNLACPRHDQAILEFIYGFTALYRQKINPFYSAAVIFTDQQPLPEDEFEINMWNRLHALKERDSIRFKHDGRVSSDPSSAEYSFSLGEEAFFVLALHPASSRKARQFKYPAFIFNPHAQFEQMRQSHTYEKLKSIVRKRDIIYSGSVNPMLTDFGNASEALQYSGKMYDSTLKCPFHANNMK